MGLATGQFVRPQWLMAAALLFLTGCPSSPSDSPPRSNGANGSSTEVGGENQGPNPTEPSDSHAGGETGGPVVPLRVLVVDDRPLGEELAKQWRTIAEESLEIEHLTSADVEAAERLPAADAILYPVGLMGTLAERGQIVELPDRFWNGEKLDRRTLLDLGRKREAIWGEKPYAVPLGSQLPVVLYRADVFAKLGLSPPKTWDELPALAARLSTREDLGELAPPAGEAWNGVLEPLAEGAAAGALLVRVAASVRHRSQYSTLFDFVTMDPLIEGPPFVKALEQLVETHAMNPGMVMQSQRESVLKELWAGRAALVVAWPSTAGGADESEAVGASEAASVRFGVAPIPGTDSTYNASQKKWERRDEEEAVSVPLLGLTGRLGSVTRSSRRASAAANFLAMLSTAEWSVRVLSASTGAGMSRTAQLDSPDRWVERELTGEPARQYADIVRQSQRDTRTVMVPRVPGRGRYLAALDEAVRSAVGGEQSPEEALRAAAEKWRQITTELGVSPQKTAYRRCLGLEP